MAVNKITNSSRNKIISKSVNPLPNTPSKLGYSAQDIKNSMFKFVTDEEESIVAEINRIVDEANVSIETATQQLNANFDDLDGRVDTLEEQIVDAGKVDDVKINGTSIVSSKEANFNTKSTYNSETNKIVTETDIADFATSTSVANTYVPQTRTINNKPLSTDISLSATDVGALSSETTYVSSVNGNSGAITGIATESFVNSSINSVTAYYITKNAQGAQFATVAELNSTTTFYSGGAVRVPTRNDYCIVRIDENHNNATTRYIYQGSQWEFQYIVNETPLTAAQVSAINSGITESLVNQIGENTSARHTHTNKSLLDTYSQTEANLSDAVAKKHSHNNKSVLDATTASFTTEQQTKLASIAEGAEVNTVTSVNNKTGAVNLTANDVGALPSSTTIPVVNNGKLTIKRNGTDVGSFTANQSSNTSVNITVPTTASDVGAVATSDIVDNLTTADATKVLSANQGKVLSDAIKTETTNISNKMDKTNPTGTGSFSLNRKLNTPVGSYSFAEGYQTEARGDYGSHAEGTGTSSNGGYGSHAEGSNTQASGQASHAEGYLTAASGQASHAEGNLTKAKGENSHCEGQDTIATGMNQHVSGKYNIEDTEDKYAEIIGNGTPDTARSNARTLDWNGNEYLSGNLQASGLTDGTTTKTMSEILAGGGMKLWRYED